MQDVLMGIFTVAFLVAAFGIIMPFKGLTRKQFALIAGGCFVMMMIVVPEPKDGVTAPASTPSGGKVDEGLKVEARSESDEITAKAKFAVETRIKYTRAENPKTVSLVGAKIFDRLNDLEPGAYYVAAASSSCDTVANGAVSLSASKKGAPRWFVDCKNGNRFMVSLKEAEGALAQQKAGKLVETSRANDCTSTSVAECSMTPAQKSFNKAEATVYCDMIVEKALIADSDMEWGSDLSFGDDGEVTISRGFTAQNAFGANLKHRYFCTLDAETTAIKSLVIETPLGSKKLI